MSRNRLILGGTLSVLVAGLFFLGWYVSHDGAPRAKEAIVKPSATDLVTQDSPEKTVDQPGMVAETSADPKVELEKFRQVLEKYSKAYSALMARKAERDQEQPLANVAGNYGQAALVSVQEKHREMIPGYLEYCEKNKAAMKRLNEVVKRAHHPVAIFELLNSQEVVGDSTVGAIVDDLMRNTDYFDIVREELQDAATHELKDPAMAARLKKVTDLETLSREVGGVSAKLKAIYKGELQAAFPSEQFRNYTSEMSQASALGYAMSAYKKSWSEQIDKLTKASTTAYGEMRDMMDRYPSDSPIRSEMAQTLKDFYMQNTTSSPTKTQ